MNNPSKTSPTIMEFLLARTAEDEATAQNLMRDLEGELKEDYDGATDERGPFTIQRLLSAKMWAQYDGQSKRRSFARGQQIAALADPARVLAECKAKREVVGSMAAFEVVKADSDLTNELAIALTTAGAIRGLQVAAHHLAAVYADHPDYQEEWTA